MICNFYPFNFVISYTNKLPILWFISWYHSNNDWKYYNTFLQSCTFNQDLKEQKWQQDYVWSLNEKTYFKKPNVNATIFPYPLYTSIVYGCSIPHRHSDATQMDKMCVQFLYARRTFQIVADKEMGAHHRKTTNRTDTQSNIVPIPGRDKTYQHCNNQGVPPKMQVHFNKCLPPRMQGPFLVC